MHYFHTHFNVYPNPQGKVDACNHKAAPNFSSGEVWIVQHVHDKSSSGEDVQQQVGAHEAGTGLDVGQAEEHPKGYHKVKSVLEVGPLHPVVQGLAIAHPKNAVVGQVCDVPEQQKGSVVVVDKDVSVRFEEAFHAPTITCS